MLKALLEERKRKILETYETRKVQRKARKDFHKQAASAKPPERYRERLQLAVEHEQIYDLERLWYAQDEDRSSFARQFYV